MDYHFLQTQYVSRKCSTGKDLKKDFGVGKYFGSEKSDPKWSEKDWVKENVWSEKIPMA